MLNFKHQYYGSVYGKRLLQREAFNPVENSGEEVIVKGTRERLILNGR
ncbi:MAG: hypothetical protein R2744_02515 [Bacteroidales bacterium]